MSSSVIFSIFMALTYAHDVTNTYLIFHDLKGTYNIFFVYRKKLIMVELKFELL